ncbi:hypothetical protein CKN73_10745 [Carnobacterium divergens]|uniref:hypothetical protein n=1 Tax=Carnobacterium divergens TaxID=2748 RepID=UPI0010721D2B|nr:hypothetical protein [Carnobacterium divergens]TFJ38675.1 hypothetical protein CKN77_10840 [Carnobacterium divergens]TFJ47909.1 hypothetical protein CKN73_10745 [Carnobacterium divergens]TFJ52873.1 hypothetical protein CKN83_10645 [Carnobacterium divergens]TFJ58598.1 hypothetical protein CKN89_11090 [Carnobacterium divergens]TFJ68663.1 hypothetical protein CKN91_10700 [Carnobacterium divergens]
MKASKPKICKYPKCSKEVKSDTSLFCIEHSRNIKSKSKVVTNKILPIVLGAIIYGAKDFMKKKE